jgi:membrane-bound lytic murein transglycosylase D
VTICHSRVVHFALLSAALFLVHPPSPAVGLGPAQIETRALGSLLVDVPRRTDASTQAGADAVEAPPTAPHFDLTGIRPPFDLDHLDYPQVHAYLEYWTTTGRRRMASLLSRSGRYRDLILEALAEAERPADLLYLVAIESGFNPCVESRAGAVGLWQFMPRTARGRGLTVERRFDERCDPERATEAGIAYLSELHERFGSWPLAMAAYNAGRGHVMQELRRYNLNDFWVMDDYSAIYDDTRGYVYKIVAAAIIGQDPARFGFDGVVPEPAIVWDTVDVPGATRLRDVARALDVDVDELMRLNPALTSPVAPNGDSFALHIPAGRTADFVRAFDDIEVERDDSFVYTTRFGDTVETVSTLFGLPERALRAANGLGRRESTGYGTELVIPLAPDEASALLAAREDRLSDDQAVVIIPQIAFDYSDRERVFYEVQRGDDVWSVAAAFEVSPYELGMWNDIDPAVEIHTGMVLQVWPDHAPDPERVRFVRDDAVRALPVGSEEFVAWDEDQSQSRQRRARTYTVRRGDTLSRIAQRHGVSTRDLIRWNDLSSPNNIRAGQELRVRR